MPSPAFRTLLEDVQLASVDEGGKVESEHPRRESERGRPIKMLFRLVVMGSSRVGKTALISQFLYDTFVANHKPTVEELHRGEYEISGTTVILDVLDTSGTYSFPAMRALSIEKADGFVLVYAVDDVQSFEEVRALREQILEGRRGIQTSEGDIKPSASSSPIPPIVVVANKSDLRGGDKSGDVTAETTVCIDWEHGFVEASAKDNRNVDRIFQELLSRVDNFRFDGKSDLERRYSCPPTFLRRTSGVSPQSASGVKRLLKRHSCSIS